MKKYLIGALLLSSVVYAQTTLIEKKIVATGEGKDIKSARNDALIQVINQTQGVFVDSQKEMLTASLEYSKNVSGNSSYKNEDLDAYKQYIFTKSKGFINGYEVLSSECNKSCKVKVMVNVKSYEIANDTSTNRKKISIFPFVSNYNQEIADKITNSVIAHISQTRKFTLLDRSNSQVFAQEKHILKGEDYNPIELSRFGKALGADYIMVGEVVGYELSYNNEKSNLTGNVSQSAKLRANVEYKILSVVTKEIKYANTITLEKEYENRNDSFLFQKSIDEIAQKISYQILDNIYPIRVVDISDSGDVILNIGGNNIKVGDVYEIYYEGKSIIDKYTKEIIAKDEIYAGEIEVTRVLPKISYAKVTNANGAISQWMVARKKSVTNTINTNVGKKEADVEIINNGGVRLPFD